MNTIFLEISEGTENRRCVNLIVGQDWIYKIEYDQRRTGLEEKIVRDATEYAIQLVLRKA